MIIQVSDLGGSKKDRAPLGSSSLIDMLAVHADRLPDEPLPQQRRSSLVTELNAVPDGRDPRGIAGAGRVNAHARRQMSELILRDAHRIRTTKALDDGDVATSQTRA
jgi:hypothetical protein